MGFIFRRRISILPGVKLNVGKRGASVSLGKRGASININKRGVYGNVGLPGTGISYREQIYKPQNTNARIGGKKGKTLPSNISFANHNSEEHKKTLDGAMLPLLLLILGAAVIIFYILSFISEEYTPGTRLIYYSVASVGLTVWLFCLGMKIDSLAGGNSLKGLFLPCFALIITGIVFLVWCNLWPSCAISPERNFFTREHEIVNLDGWKTFCSVLSCIIILAGTVTIFIGLYEPKSKSDKAF